MAKIIIETNKCKGCKLCVAFCPKELISMGERLNRRGVFPAVFKDSGECTGCCVCAQMCPDVVIEVYK